MKTHLSALAFAALCSGGIAYGQTYSPTASTEVYTLNGINEDILELFYNAEQNGRLYPTDAEFEAAGISLMDLAFIRSHVRPQSLLLDHSKDINSGVTENRKLWMNIPIGIGKNSGGYPSSNFNDDTFTGWNYTNVFGSWNHGVFHVPGVAVDCAHKNGSDIYSGIKFFESWTAGSGASGWVGKVQTKDTNGYDGYKYVRPLVNAMMYFGHDGLNYNFEDTGYAQTDVVKFHQACYKYAAERGFDNFHIGIYTSISLLTASCVEALFGKNGIKTADAFLNYSSSDFQSASNIRSSVSVAENAMGTCDGVYQGAWIVSMARSWSNLGNSSSTSTVKKMGIVLWGEHNQSRLMSWCSGNSAIDFQENYQKLQDRFFSGGYRNPATRPTSTNSADWSKESASETGLRTFQGLAEYIPERTAIKHDLPFITYFSTGAGERYNYKGKKTHGSWYNLGQQDVVPTYRWLVYNSGTTTSLQDNSYEGGGTNNGVPEFTNADAYIGGSCLRLTNTSAVDIVLYRTELTSSTGMPTATLALKVPEGVTASGTVSVIYKLKGNDTWVAGTASIPSGHEWVESLAPLRIPKNGVIEYIGLRTSGNTNGVLVGGLSIIDSRQVSPAYVTNTYYEVKEETQSSLSVKLRWDVDATAVTRADNGLVYNDEANIDHFEIFYKNCADAEPQEVARTTSWSAYVGNILMGKLTEPWIGVRSVSVDGKTASPIVWKQIQRADASMLPATNLASSAYPTIIMNDGSEGIDNALAQRYVTQFVVSGSDADFTYTNNVGTPYQTDNTNKTNYILATNTIKGHQGQKITCKLSYSSQTDGLQYCTARGYADWDGDHNFNATNDELIWSLGASNAKSQNTALTNPSTFTFTIPEDAVTGENRVRIVFSDAWFPHPGSSGTFSKGFAIDFPMEITGTNPARTVTDTHDQYLLGDINSDGHVSIADLTELDGILANNSKYSAGLQAPSFYASDVNGDKKLNLTDTRIMRNRILQLADEEGSETDPGTGGGEGTETETTTYEKITTTSELSSSKTYIIQNAASGKYVQLQSAFTESNVINATPLVGTEEEATGFTISGSGSSFTISDGTYYVGVSSSKAWNSSASSSATTWTIAASGDAFTIVNPSTSKYWKYDGSNNYVYVDGDSSSSNKWYIFEKKTTKSTAYAPLLFLDDKFAWKPTSYYTFW